MSRPARCLPGSSVNGRILLFSVSLLYTEHFGVFFFQFPFLVSTLYYSTSHGTPSSRLVLYPVLSMHMGSISRFIELNMMNYIFWFNVIALDRD